MGPELWWGANPALMVKYNRRIGPFDATAVFQEDLEEQAVTTSSFAIPVPPTRKGALHLAASRGSFDFEIGGIWSGNTKVGETFDVVAVDGSKQLLQDEVKDSDTFGVKAKVTAQSRRWNWYGQAAYMGIVADGGPTAVQNFTGWTLKDSGLGNQANVISGFTYGMGEIQIGPNVLYQKPIVGPVPADLAEEFGRAPRNVLADPFAVRANRETFGAEVVFAYDPTPATWMWMWDNDAREDAAFAASLNLIYRDFPTTQDASIGIAGDGRTTFPFPGAPPAREHWEAKLRVVSRLRADRRLVAHVYAGTGEPNGNDERLIHRYGADARLTMGSIALESFVKLNDWGPYDYHRDGNLTFPVQLMADVGYTLGSPRWFGFPQTRLGVRGVFRTLDRFSPRYCPTTVADATGSLVCDPLARGFDDGNEWEIRTYLHFAM
jgi:hypothetical protein